MINRNILLITILVLSLIPNTVFAQAQKHCVVNAKHTINPVKLDGILDDWGNTEWQQIASGLPHVSSLNELVNDGGTEPIGTALTAADLSGSFSFQWNDNYLYLAAKITDNVHIVGSDGGEGTWFMRDGVALFLDVPNDDDGRRWISGDHTFAFPATNNISGWWRHGDPSGQRELALPEDILYHVQLEKNNGYVLEAAIPMQRLALHTPAWQAPFHQRRLGFLILVPDPDGIEPRWGGQLIYGGDNDNDANWADLLLSPPSPPTKPSPKIDQGTISGIVTLRTTNDPWKGGTLHAIGLENNLRAHFVPVDSLGAYKLSLPAGNYRLSAAGQSTTVTVRPQQAIHKLNFSVDPVILKLNITANINLAHHEKLYQRLLYLLSGHDFHLSPNLSTNNSSSLPYQFYVPSMGLYLTNKVKLETDPQWIKLKQSLAPLGNVPIGPLLHLQKTPSGPGQTRPFSRERIVKTESIQQQAGRGLANGSLLSLGIPDGLPYPAIQGILKGKDGSLWLLSGGLLNNWQHLGLPLSYDGEFWTSFKNQNGKAAIRDGGVLGATEDGSIWVGSAPLDGQTPLLSRFDGTAWYTHNHADLFDAFFVSAIFSDGPNSMWLGTSNGAIHKTDQSLTLLTIEDGLPHNQVTAISKDRVGNYWFGTKKGISVFDGTSFQNFYTYNGLPNNEISSLLNDRNGQTWIGTTAGLSRYSEGEFVSWGITDGLPSTDITALFEDLNGEIWIGTTSGLCKFNNSRFEKMRMLESSSGILSIGEDNEGHLWLGTVDGLIRYEHTDLQQFTHNNGLPSDEILALSRDADDNIWMATSKGVSRFNGDTLKTFTAADGIHPGDIKTVLANPEGYVWVASSGGLSFFDGKKWTQSETLPGTEFRSTLGVDKSNRMWFSTMGTFHTDKEGRWQRFSSAGAIEGEFFSIIPGLLQDTNDKYWFRGVWGGNMASLCTFDGTTWANLSANQNAPQAARCGLATSDGQVWIGTNEGAFKYTDGKSTKLGVEEGLSHPFVNSIIEDDRGHIWFGTAGGGISIYDGSAMQHLSRQDGLLSNTVSDLLEDSDGTIWIATKRGVNRYTPGITSPPVKVTAVVADKRYKESESINIPASQDFVGFEFQATSFKTRPEQMLYSYRLQPENSPEKPWQFTRKKRVEYQKLKRGNYTFQVKAIDKDLNYSNAPAERHLNVHVPYNQWLYGLGLALACSGLIAAIFLAMRKRRQLRRTVIERDEAREQLLKELQTELDTARNMQQGLMPHSNPQIPGFDIAGICRAATHVGGDFFQYFPLPNGRLSMVVADVTGHGMEAAIPTVLFSGILDNQMETINTPESLFSGLNRSLFRILNRRTFVCFSLGELDPTRQLLKLANGGCPYPYHFRYASGTVKELPLDAFPLGLRQESVYKSIEIKLEAGDRVVFCSDGIIEATNSDDEIFGFERTGQTIQQAAIDDLSPTELIENVLATVDSFCAYRPQQDDQTIVVLSVN